MDGLYDKYEVKRTDGTSSRGGKHDGCSYFVLDLNHDRFAPYALLVYAQRCETEYPKLAADLRKWASETLTQHRCASHYRDALEDIAQEFRDKAPKAANKLALKAMNALSRRQLYTVKLK